MKEDYLWDKTGSDPEIEGLENALKAFRYKETELLPMPVRETISPEKPRRQWFFALAFAGAAACIVLAISVIVLRQTTSPKPSDTVASSPQPVDKVVSPNEPLQVVDNNTPQQEPSKKQQKPAPAKPEQFRPQYLVLRTPEIEEEKPRGNSVKRNRPAKMQKASYQKPEFTKEEKDAYDKLMLALSITSSQFKTVKDKVNGVKPEPLSNSVSPLNKEELR